MHMSDDEDRLLHSVAMQNAQSILLARQRAEQTLLSAHSGLEDKARELDFSLSMMRATLEAIAAGFNQQYVRMWGIPEELMAPRDHERLLSFVGPQVEGMQAYLDRVHEIYRTSPAESFDLLKLRDGRIYERSSKMQFVEGRHVGRVWVFRDITEQRRAEDALHKKARVLELLNKTGTILTAKLDVRMLAQAGVSIDNARLYEVARQAAEEREKLLDSERAARSEAEHMSRMKDEFLAMLAHELRNPLAPLRNSVEILRRGSAGPLELEETRAIMDRQIAHMTRLVDDLLDVNRISRGKLELRLEKISLADALRSAVETSRPLITGRQHTFEAALPDDSVLVDADLVRLSQAFTNLLDNAAKYTPDGGAVALRTVADALGVTVSVEDTGIGIPEHLGNRIFDMFVQGEANSSMPQPQGGLGIGLTLVRKIIEMHGGRIRVESRDDRPGSRFVVWLPVAKGAPAQPEPGADAAPSPEPARAPGTAFEPRRILVADDNRDAAFTLASLLGMMGHEVRTAHDGAEAIATTASFSPQIIFLDIGMPHMDGYEACRRIRQLAQAPAPVIVALTGWGQADDKRKAQEAGFDHHFTKPVDPAQLEELVGSNL